MPKTSFFVVHDEIPVSIVRRTNMKSSLFENQKKPMTSSSIAKPLKDVLMKVLNGEHDKKKEKHTGLKFPLPESLPRFKLSLVKSELYVTTLKLDGLRVLAIIDQLTGVITLINRKLEVVLAHPMIANKPKVKKKLSSTCYSIFDAEFMQEQNTLVLFDTIIFNGRPAIHLCLSVRIELTRSFVGSDLLFREIDNHTTGASSQIPLLPTNLLKPGQLNINGLIVKPKIYTSSAHASLLWSSRTTSEFSVDGLIFSPLRSNYTDSIHFKWKELITVDFAFILRDSSDELSDIFGLRDAIFRVPDGNVVMLTTPITMIKNRVIFSFMQLDNPDNYIGKIVECFFDVASSVWKPVLVRTDKKFPNTIRTVVRSCNDILDNVLIDDFQ